jgi:N-acetylmuramoyl-L-alanine amidase
VKRVVVLNGVIGVLVVILIVIFNYSYLDVFLTQININHSKIIMIDAGHGGIDGGAVGATGTVEKNINLSISKKLKGYLDEQGYSCIMVRETDEGLYSQYGTIRNKKNEDLRNRKQLIKEYGCNVFISIHVNKFPESQYSGAQVFYLKGDIESHKLAKAVQDDLKSVINRGNTRVEKPSNEYYLFKGNTIPSIIVECGFVSNYAEEQLLKDDSYQNKLAWSIFSGLIKYLKEPEKIQTE